MPFDYASRIYDVLCALSDGRATSGFDARIVDAARMMVSERGSMESALLYCSCLLA
jgi:hypothetical protein